MSELIDVRREGALARVVMHRKGNNAIAEDLMAELAAAFDELGKDPAARVIVLTSEYEKYFSVGADLTSMMGIDREAPDAADQIALFMRRMNDHFAAIERCPKPVIAAINGHALGGGSELTLCCDFRIMVEDGRSRIGQTESSLGIIPGAGGTQRLPRLIGMARAKRYIIESTRLSAREAEAGSTSWRTGSPGRRPLPSRWPRTRSVVDMTGFSTRGSRSRLRTLPVPP